ncbi:MAG: hypothetical protein R2707_21140 [Acidimicrobiales bacterium]
MAVLAVAALTTACDPDDVYNGVCDAENMCMYEHAGYTGRVMDPGECDGEWACGFGDFSQVDYWDTDTSPNDKTSAIKNRITTKAYTTMWVDAVGGGGKFCSPSGFQYSNLSTFPGTNYNDKFSSEASTFYNPCAF